MNSKKTLLTALIISVIGLTSWEMYQRSQGNYPTLNDDKALWAMHRAKLEKPDNDVPVFLGSSRVLFDIQLDEWEAATGIRPMMLACAGSSPLPVFRDIVENTDFSGTIVVGVTPGLFFSTTFPLAEPWSWPKSRIDHYHDRTYAQRINQSLSIPLQQNLVFMSASEGEASDDIDLKSLLKRFNTGERGGPQMPPFYSFADIDLDRNVKMTERTANDTAFAKTVIDVWNFFGKGAPPSEKEATMNFFLEDVKKFKERGGNLILLRCPSTEGYRIGESMGQPRAEYWDVLVDKAQVKGYHFEDYESLKHFRCPEWSHLSATDAGIFTTELANIMMKDKALTNSKTN